MVSAKSLESCLLSRPYRRQWHRSQFVNLTCCTKIGKERGCSYPKKNEEISRWNAHINTRKLN